MSAHARSAKAVTRRTLRDARAARPAAEAAAVEEALAAHATAVLAAATSTPAPAGTPVTVALYRSLPGEPGTGLLRAALRRAGHRVLLPVLLPDRDLDWVEDTDATGGPPDGPGPDPLRPAGPRLGTRAPASCALVLVPALAVDAAGTRLGQGGGSYDRAMARLPAGPGRPLVLAVVHDDEVLAGPLPREPHDVGVDGALTPSGLLRWR